MRSGWLVLLGVCLVVTLFGCAGPSNQATAKESSSVRTAATVQDMPPVCPVTGHAIEDPKVAPNSVYEGKRYYFQCPSCKAEFDRDPAKYAASFDEKVAAAKTESDSSDKSDESAKSETSH